ncbi:MAG: type II secretion system protein, partial [Oscillospiraceae bacterium]
MAKLLRKSKKGGFTLIELIIAITVAMILLLAITTTLMPSIRFFQETARWGTDKSASNTIYKTISERLRYSSEILVYKDYTDDELTSLVYSAANIDDKFLILKIKNDLSDGAEGKGRLQVATAAAIKSGALSGSAAFSDLFLEDYYKDR